MPITSVRDYENNIWKRNAKRTKKKNNESKHVALECRCLKYETCYPFWCVSQS